MGVRFSLRPRLLLISLVVAVVVSVSGGLVLAQLMSDDGTPVDADLDEPGQHTEPVDTSETSSGERLPDVGVTDVDGQTVQTGSFVGEPLVINVWYPSCAPCKREMPDLAQVSEEFAGQVRFVGINIQKDVDAMVDFARETGVPYDLFIDELGEFNTSVRVVGFPTTLFVGADGTIVEHHTGPLDADGIRARVEQIV